MNDAALDWTTTTLLASPPAASPALALFLLHEYARTGRSDVAAAAESALTSGLDRLAMEGDPLERCEWLGALVGARVFTDDQRLVTAVDRALADTIDALERMVRMLYEPGDGLRGEPIAVHVRCAAALVTAFELTGRLPYSMLAEELLQFGRRQTWDDAVGALDATFVVNCAASALYSRLALLHRDADYVAAAVIARDADYARDAERMLRWATTSYRDHAESAADFGLAVVHWFALRALPN